MILAPMVEDGKEAVGSMGDDTPLAVLSDKYRPLQPLLPPELQPGDQPADRPPARDRRDEPEDPVQEPRQHPGAGREPRPTSTCWTARSLTTGMYERMVGLHRREDMAVIDCTMPMPAAEAGRATPCAPTSTGSGPRPRTRRCAAAATSC